MFLRLQGCGVGCPFCDTKETWDLDYNNEQATLPLVMGANPQFTSMSGSEINAYIVKAFPHANWVVITGGEPALYNLTALVNALHDGGYKVALETSGTEPIQGGQYIDWICVSPKFDMPGGKVVLLETVSMADEIKHVVGRQADIDLLDTHLKTWTLKEGSTICLQPMSQSKRATELCIKTAQERGWRLSIQTHKYIQIA